MRTATTAVEPSSHGAARAVKRAGLTHKLWLDAQKFMQLQELAIRRFVDDWPESITRTTPGRYR